MANTPELKIIYAMLQAQVQVISGLVALNDLQTAQQGNVTDLLNNLRQEFKQAMSDLGAQFRSDFQEVLRRVDAQTTLLASLREAQAGREKLLRDQITALMAQDLTPTEFGTALHTTLDTLRNNDQAIIDATLAHTPADPNVPAPVDTPPAPAPAPTPTPAPEPTPTPEPAPAPEPTPAPEPAPTPVEPTA